MGILRRSKRVKTIDVVNVDEIRQEKYIGKYTGALTFTSFFVVGPFCIVWLFFPVDKRIVVQHSPVVVQNIIEQAPEVIEARVL